MKACAKQQPSVLSDDIGNMHLPEYSARYYLRNKVHCRSDASGKLAEDTAEAGERDLKEYYLLPSAVAQTPEPPSLSRRDNNRWRHEDKSILFFFLWTEENAIVVWQIIVYYGIKGKYDFLNEWRTLILNFIFVCRYSK